MQLAPSRKRGLLRKEPAALSLAWKERVSFERALSHGEARHHRASWTTSSAALETWRPIWERGCITHLTVTAAATATPGLSNALRPLTHCWRRRSPSHRRRLMFDFPWSRPTESSQATESGEGAEVAEVAPQMTRRPTVARNCTSNSAAMESAMRRRWPSPSKPFLLLHSRLDISHARLRLPQKNPCLPQS
ncbi:uncharacterized protein LOC144094636 [Amblyomma americanum]